jgi:threonine/homoserine/homoserine lactone efflux protein
MGNAIGNILPYAVGVALSPVPIIAVILMLFSSRARTVAPALLVGWMAGLAIVGAIVLAVAGGLDSTGKRTTSTAGAIVQLLLGLLLLFLAYRQWRGRPRSGEEAHLPRWMTSLDQFTPLKALGLGALLSAVNPKNLPLTIGASVSIATANLPTAQTIIVLVVYIILASASIGGPVIFYLIADQRAARTLDTWKTWLSANNAAVMAVLTLVFSAILLGKGIGGLTS